MSEKSRKLVQPSESLAKSSTGRRAHTAQFKREAVELITQHLTRFESDGEKRF